jgi:hypothetical protein
MSTNADIQRLESEVEDNKEQLREDVSQIKEKVQETRAQLSPTKFVRERVFLLMGLALGLGYVVGYGDVPVEQLAKPAARTILTTAGKHAVIRAIRG